MTVWCIAAPQLVSVNFLTKHLQVVARADAVLHSIFALVYLEFQFIASFVRVRCLDIVLFSFFTVRCATQVVQSAVLPSHVVSSSVCVSVCL